MLILPRSVRIGSLNARPLTKIDIVNPIPPNTVMAASCIQVVLAGLAASLHLIPNQLKKKIPRGLPMSSPKNIPSARPGM